MADGRDDAPVSYGRWQEAHAALVARVDALAAEVRASNWSAEVTLARTRLDALEAAIARLDTAQAKRKDRQWALILVFLSGLALPLAVIAIVALVSAHGL